MLVSSARRQRHCSPNCCASAVDARVGRGPGRSQSMVYATLRCGSGHRGGRRRDHRRRFDAGGADPLTMNRDGLPSALRPPPSALRPPPSALRPHAMFVLFGTRYCGTVDLREGQYQTTEFFHIWYMPLIPLSSIWVISKTEGELNGHKIPLSLRSVFAGYARYWGVYSAVLAGVVGGPIGYAAVAGITALWLWTWTWRSIRGLRQALCSDLNLLAFGTRCDPLKMPNELVEEWRVANQGNWSRTADGRTAQDVARLGASGLQQAVLAYAELRIAERSAVGTQRQRIGEDVNRIIRSLLQEGKVLDGSPYRALAEGDGNDMRGTSHDETS